jgi:hypothetical protein
MTTTNEAWTAWVKASIEWAKHMDQCDKFRFQTKYGPVFVTMRIIDDYPDSFEEVDGEGNVVRGPGEPDGK